jgi:ABC-2 type transport system permease protein
MVLGSVGLRARDVWFISNLAYALTLLLCGVNVPLSAMPSWIAAVGRAMPLTHGVQAARELVAGAGLADVAGLIGREALTGLVYGVVAYVLLRCFEAESRRRATLDLL